MARTCHHLGIVAHDDGCSEEARSRHREAHEIFEKLGDRLGMAACDHQRGRLAEARGAHAEAADWYRRALSVFEAADDLASMASTYHQLGVLAQIRGAYEEAEDLYRKGLEIDERLGARADQATSMTRLGMLYTERGKPEVGAAWNLRSLVLRLELSLPELAVDLHWLSRQRELLGEERFLELLDERMEQPSRTVFLEQLDRYRRVEAERSRAGDESG